MSWSPLPHLLRIGIAVRRPWLVGKTILIGITDCSKDWEPISQTQLIGKIHDVSRRGIRVLLQDGRWYNLPPDARAMKRARKGQYRLRATGQIVEDPDYLFTYRRIPSDLSPS